MEHVEAAYQAGVAEAQGDIKAGQCKLRYGVRSFWGEDLRHTLWARFKVELIVLSCFTHSELRSFNAGYNTTVETHIDAVHGPGSLAAVWNEVQDRRQKAYDEWTARQKQK